MYLDNELGSILDLLLEHGVDNVLVLVLVHLAEEKVVFQRGIDPLDLISRLWDHHLEERERERERDSMARVSKKSNEAQEKKKKKKSEKKERKKN